MYRLVPVCVCMCVCVPVYAGVHATGAKTLHAAPSQNCSARQLEGTKLISTFVPDHTQHRNTGTLL